MIFRSRSNWFLFPFIHCSRWNWTNSMDFCCFTIEIEKPLWTRWRTFEKQKKNDADDDTFCLLFSELWKNTFQPFLIRKWNDVVENRRRSICNRKHDHRSIFSQRWKIFPFQLFNLILQRIIRFNVTRERFEISSNVKPNFDVRSLCILSPSFQRISFLFSINVQWKKRHDDWSSIEKCLWREFRRFFFDFDRFFSL